MTFRTDAPRWLMIKKPAGMCLADLKRMNILIEPLVGKAVSEQGTEIVERKGLGHPDSICDAVMEQVSLALTREYIKAFGVILHHNVDKGLLVGGSVERRFKGGRVLEPMRLIFGDRAANQFGKKKIPVAEIAIETAKQWFRQNLRFVDPDRHFIYQVEIRPGSSELQDIFAREKGLLGANDTSAAVGYAPLTDTESLVLETELFLNSIQFKKQFPETGEDIKLMAIRNAGDLDLIVAMPLIDRFISDEDSYFERKRILQQQIRKFVRDKYPHIGRLRINLNTLDRNGRGLGGMYLSVLGTSAEDADSGEVGRGNRVNGLIPLNRPSSLEAAAGKNAVSHVGKIYNVLSHRIAHTLYQKVPGIKEVYVWMVSRIGQRIDQPALVTARILPAKKGGFDVISRKAQALIKEELAAMPAFCDDLLKGKYPVA